ncbi:MAG: hypothetical protein LBT45_03475, partial [Rickettsiales bacterium]|nr:hypothetical protein [Rickettsiales bacterium]
MERQKYIHPPLIFFLHWVWDSFYNVIESEGIWVQGCKKSVTVAVREHWYLSKISAAFCIVNPPAWS